ncbi:bifunctional sugar-1-phosphate nucleotidylyltransferase/acetyltransferase [Candidatus Bathycorpusculum sp.]|uniref:bifunctional sugar-1-phosphate nucleotidylyltransferase/acetyltransferase n=1 Tax=Candidatus Bathycorpusculum sp. TaxID=2994959 RepID=UPI00282EE9AD|nr:sugar phosphate nucleotidyltransferase [Candidatus Termitimicrobium sp.]MCL2431995.1 sugar phosphate nucleotidyltransferase [Candidatus Termitimicrobium sp.]
MKAVLLAAGAGERLQPLTATRPKHLLKVAGKPLLQFSLEAIKHAGIDEAILITHYRGEAIESYFGDGTKLGLELSYLNQPQILGTGNAAGIAEPFLDGDFVLIYGDLLFGIDTIKTVVSKFKSYKPAAVMGVVSVDCPENYGIIEQTTEGAVKRIVEKPPIDKAPSRLANAGVYAFSKQVFNRIRQIKASIRGELELTDAITMLVEEGQTVLSTELSKEDWFDVGRPWDLLNANGWALKRMEHRVLGKVEEGAHLIGPVSVAASARIRSGAYIEGPVFIDEESDIGPNCYIRSNTSLGRKTRVGNAVEIKNSILMDGTHVGHLSYVGDSILGEKCNLGAGTITANLRFDDGNIKMQIKDKCVDTGRRKLGVILGDNVKTGIKTLFMPGVKVGTNTWVGANVMVEQDLPANSVALLKQNIKIMQKPTLKSMRQKQSGLIDTS